MFAFRCRFSLAERPGELRVRVSADNRYKLYVNGQFVDFGPQRGDERHWFYETLDIAPFLREGENEVRALVWNFGWLAPMAQHSVRTGFVLEVDPTQVGCPVASTLNTPGDWQVARVEGWDFQMMHSGIGEFYIDIGPGEIIDGERTEGFGDFDWKSPNVICAAEARGTKGGGTQWMLIPRSIPAMRYERRVGRPVVRHGYDSDPNPFGGDKRRVDGAIVLQPGERVLLDYQQLTNAFPRLTAQADGGKGTLVLTYAEALQDKAKNKDHRDVVVGKDVFGVQDRFLVGESASTFEPLWWRCYRYLLLEAVDAPITVSQIEAMETGYPLRFESSFEADDPWVKPIWDVSVRTAELCAGETYFDCPYYEQLQYVGDTRIQALIGYYAGRDRALTRNAVETIGWSLMENGLTQSRYPSRQTQVIPPFSLWWVMMLYDQLLYDSVDARPDFATSEVVKGVLSGFRRVSKEKAGEGQFWQFGDWVPEWKWGVPPGEANALMHQLTLSMAELAARRYRARDHKWDGRDFEFAGMSFLPFADSALLMGHVRRTDSTPSEHAQAIGRILMRMAVGAQASPGLMKWPSGPLDEVNAARATYYFSYYKHLGMETSDYMEQLGPWKEQIESGLTTFAENPEPTRSDCHAWSAHPILGFLQIVAGVTSVEAGWARARIEPRPGSLKRFKARIAHPKGELVVGFEDGVLAVDSPVRFDLVWRGQRQSFKAGSYRF